MTLLDRSRLMFSLNNNSDCIISDASRTKRIIFTKNGLFSKDKEILVLLNDTYFHPSEDHELYGHVVKNIVVYGVHVLY